VKQSKLGGTFLHGTWGITGFFGGKTPLSGQTFCERNENRIKFLGLAHPGREQRGGCSVFNNITVIKKFSRSVFS
jgi:hypothetical protein